MICMECNKAFSLRSSLVYHVRKWHPKFLNETQTVTCNICDRVLGDKNTFQNHMRNRHGEAKTAQDMCNICEKSFYSQQTLRAHTKTVHGETKMCLK